MRVLFVHQNFPGQYLHLAPAMAARGHNVKAFTIQQHPVPKGVQVIKYTPQRGSSKNIHPWVTDIETKVIRGEAAAGVAMSLRKQGYIPDLICAHAGWGESLFLKDVWPEARLLTIFELHYQVQGGDASFDPEFSTDDARNRMRLRMKNANSLLNLDTADHGVSATRFQWSTLPEIYRPRVSVIHEGIDTTTICPDAGAQLALPSGQVLTRQDEVITFVGRNLEPYRGYHVFMRALPEILRRRPKAQVVIVGGDGVSYGKAAPEGSTWKQIFLDEVKDKLDMSRVHFLGMLPRDQFTRMLQVSSAHIYLTYPFVLSWSMIEAMSCGALVIGSSTAPVMEVLEDGRNGLLVDFFSRDEICNAIDRVMDHPDRMQVLRDAARRTAVAGYDLQAVCLPRQIALAEGVAAGKIPVF
jgi:glycosyltransferase involved in cell wall biosynthesis